MAIEKYHDNTFGTFLWNDILFVCEISGVLPPERGGKVFGEFDFTSVVSCETLHEKPLLGLHRSIDVGEIEVGAQVKHLLPAGDGQGVFTLEIGIPDMSLCIDTGETQGLLLDVGDRVSLVIRGLRFFPYEL